MKIAFVNQPIDRLLPPIQSSIGACTYGVARPLAQSCEVVVYGRKDTPAHVHLTDVFTDQQVQYRLFSSTVRDRILFKAWWKYARLVQLMNRGLKPPISTSSWLFPDFGRQVALDLQAQQCDVIHVQHCSQYVPLIRALNPTAKILLHLHAEWFPQSNYAALAKRLQSVDRVTTVGNHITEKIRRLFPQIADRCYTLYNGIEAGDFAPEKDYCATHNSAEKRILYVGGVSPHKGVHILIQAFEQVLQQYPNAHLHLVGKQGAYPLEETYDMTDKALIRRVAPYYAKDFVAYLRQRLSPDVASHTTFWGAVPRADLVQHYYKADVFVFAPIWNEGFGIPPVEAMAAGTPVVVTRSGALTETVLDGKTGMVVNPNDVPTLADAIGQLLQDDSRRESLGKAGRQRVLEQFTWDQIAQDLLHHYQQLCESEQDSIAHHRSLVVDRQ